MATPALQLSTLDEQRFGVRTVKIEVASPADVATVLEFCRQESVRLLIARCPADAWAAAHALEANAGRLMDVLVYFARDLLKTPVPEPPATVSVREATPADAEAVTAVARGAFHDYQGHYHMDPRLDRAACDEVYVSWAHRSCLSQAVAHAVFVATQGADLLGFLTMRLNNPQEAEVCLNGVTPSAQGRGLYRALLIHALRWAQTRHCERVIVSTQVTNIASQKVWTRVGFEPSHGYLTFHRWFDS